MARFRIDPDSENEPKFKSGKNAAIFDDDGRMHIEAASILRVEQKGVRG